MNDESALNPQFIRLLESVRQCRLCEKSLPMGPRPVLQLDPKARIQIAGQAPGRRVHETGVPLDDPSGDDVIPLPHPSPRNNIWLKKYPWFSGLLLPELKKGTQQALKR